MAEKSLNKSVPAVFLLLSLLQVSAPLLARDDLPAALSAALQQPQIIQQLERNKVVSGPFKRADEDSAVSMWATILIHASTENVHTAIIMCAEAPQYYQNLHTCTVTEKGDGFEIIQQQIKLIWFLPKLEYTFRADYSKPLEEQQLGYKTIRYQLVSGDLKVLEGGWNLYPQGDNTLAVHFISIKPRLPLPGWIVRSALENDLPESLEIIRSITNK